VVAVAVLTGSGAYSAYATDRPAQPLPRVTTVNQDGQQLRISRHDPGTLSRHHRSAAVRSTTRRDLGFANNSTTFAIASAKRLRMTTP